MTILRFGDTEAQLNWPLQLTPTTRPSSTPHVAQIAPCNNSGLLAAPGVQLFPCKTLKCSIFYIALGASRHFLQKQASCHHVMYYRSSIVLPFPLIKTLPGNAGQVDPFLLYNSNPQIQHFQTKLFPNPVPNVLPSNPPTIPKNRDLLSQVWWCACRCSRAIKRIEVSWLVRTTKTTHRYTLDPLGNAQRESIVENRVRCTICFESTRSMFFIFSLYCRMVSYKYLFWLTLKHVQLIQT